MYKQTIVDYLNPYKIIFPFLKYGYDYVNNNRRVTYPWAVEIHPTAKCNHRCIHCSYKVRNENRSQLSKDIFKGLVNDLIDCKVKGVYFSGGGEPCAYDGLSDAIVKLNDNGVEVSLITNGTLVAEKGIIDIADHLNYIAVSVPSCTKDTFEKITGSKKMDTVLNIPNQIKSRFVHPPVVGARIVITNLIVDEVYYILTELKRYNYDYALFKIVRDYEDRGLGISLEAEEYLRDMIRKKEREIDREFTNITNLFLYKKNYINIGKCHINTMGLLAAITPDGDVYPNISEIGDARFLVGNLSRSSFSELWGTERHKEVISNSNDNWQQHKCKNCRCISYNNILNAITENVPLYEDVFI